MCILQTKLYNVVIHIKKLPKKARYVLLDLYCPWIVKRFIGLEIARSNIEGTSCIFRAVTVKGCNWPLSTAVTVKGCNWSLSWNCKIFGAGN